MSKLYIIPTPIGNLEDITLRAIRYLKESDFVIAEDTRTSGNLLRHLSISKPLVSFHIHNEHKALQAIISRIKGGEIACLVSDAGTPAISDPGFLLVREAIIQGIEVDCLPGPTALIPAIVMSGYPCDKFIYEGFLPQKKGRVSRISKWKEEERTVVFYESPHRLRKALEQMEEILGPLREIAVSREISKMHQQCIRGTIAEVKLHFEKTEPKGEIVVVLKTNSVIDNGEKED